MCKIPNMIQQLYLFICYLLDAFVYGNRNDCGDAVLAIYCNPGKHGCTYKHTAV